MKLKRFVSGVSGGSSGPEPVLLALDPQAEQCAAQECHLRILADASGNEDPVVLQNWQIPQLPEDAVVWVLDEPGHTEVAGRRLPVLKAKLTGGGDTSGLSDRERRLSRGLAGTQLPYVEPERELLEAAVRELYE